MKSAYSLAFFDVDSTLVSVEGIDFLAGDNREVVSLTEAAMTGEIPIEQVYERRLAIVRPDRADLERLATAYLNSLVDGAEEVVGALKDAGVDVHLVTAGIAQAVLTLAARFDISQRAVHAVAVQLNEQGRYAGFDHKSPLTRSRGKETVVLDVRARSHGRALYVGDGVTDLDVKDAVDLFVGFGGVRVRERVRAEADVFVMELREILPLVFECHPERSEGSGWRRQRETTATQIPRFARNDKSR